jgi:predicted CopG family antitoxin
MGTKTIGLRDDVYERLKAQKRNDESFTETVERLLDESTTDWRDGFGTLSEGDQAELEQVVADSRTLTSEGIANRQREALKSMSAVDEETDETA